jgi:N-acetylmuramoyl-L-alanine amidase
VTQQNIYLLDAGHSPETPGKRSPVMDDGRQLLEWEYTRDICNRVADKLEQEGIAFHVLTPRCDYDVGPSARAGLANEINGAVNIPAITLSLHGNAAGQGGWQEADGVAVFYWHTSDRGAAMAERCCELLCEHTGLDSRGPKPSDYYSILKKTNHPALILEMGFYTDPDEVLFLLSNDGRQKFADGIVAFIKELEAA